MSVNLGNVKINKSAQAAIEILEQGGLLQVTVSKPGASAIFAVQDYLGSIVLNWCNCSQLVNFANGVNLGIQIGRKLNR